MAEKLKAYKVSFRWTAPHGVRKDYFMMIYSNGILARLRAILWVLQKFGRARVLGARRMVNADDAVSYGGVVVGKGGSDGKRI